MPINITMPALSPTMTDGTLAKWLKKEGDTVAAGDVIAEIETDKATMEVEAVDEGVLGKILIAAGTENVPVNAVIAVLLEAGEDSSAIVAPAAVSAAAPAVILSETKDLKKAMPLNEKIVAGERIFASPLAKRLAKDRGLDLASIKGSGPHGRVVRDDVLSFKAQDSKPLAPNTSNLATNIYGMEYTAIPNNNIKKVTARRLTEAKQTIPHFYLSVECILDNLLAARKEINDAGKDKIKLSVNDFIIKASAMALKAYPAANTSWTDEAVHQYKHADISVAVSTPSGLITPIIKRAEEKGLQQISEEMKALAARAREGKLKPEEFMGGSFSISNLGMFGVQSFQAIVNPPQSCILAVGAGVEKAVVVNGKIEIRTVMTVTLSTDHRSVDGAVGAEWLQHFKRYIENPVTMLV